MEDEERQKKLEFGKAKVRTEGCGPRWESVAGKGWEWAWEAEISAAPVRYLGRGAARSALPARQSLFFLLKNPGLNYPADTSVMIGWRGFFLVNPQIKPFFYCIAIIASEFLTFYF